MKPINTIADLYRRIDKELNKPNALNEKVGNEWIKLSHAEFAKQIRELTLYLIQAGVKKGDAIGILAPPGIRWIVADLASILAGAVVVPLFANISEENFVFECTQPNVKTLFVGGLDQWIMYSKHKDLFDRVISLDHINNKPEHVSFDSALSIGAEIYAKDPNRFESLLDQFHTDDIATIIYTSGSTGVPKGALISHKVLVGVVYVDPFQWNPDTDSYLSILPLAHVFGRTFNFIMLSWGIPAYYFNDLKAVGEVCREIKPTITALVPRLLEKIYAKMVSNVENASFFKKSIGQWAFSLANDEQGGISKTLFQPLADKIVYSHLRDALGGNFRIIISGGAPLNPHLNHFFHEVGIPIYEGWGLTEASIVTVNNPNENKIGTVGKAIETMEVKTSPEGELLIKGPVCFSGYYKNPQLTKETIDEEGYVHSGDKGIIDSEGYITILGRIKDLVKSSVGEFIAPVPIEQALSKAPFIDLSMVVAEKRKFVSVLIFPNFEVVRSLKAAQRQEHLTDEEFLNSDYIKNEMDNLIESINKHLNHWEQIHAYRFVITPPTIETGELTPSMKIRRDVVSKKYADLIDSMYPEEAHL